jgi:hypothetical protein
MQGGRFSQDQAGLFLTKNGKSEAEWPVRNRDLISVRGSSVPAGYTPASVQYPVCESRRRKPTEKAKRWSHHLAVAEKIRWVFVTGSGIVLRCVPIITTMIVGLRLPRMIEHPVAMPLAKHPR